MALLDGKNLAAEASKRARFRVHHVGTKLNEAELHELEALAAKRKETQAELIRGLILHELARDAEGLRPSRPFFLPQFTCCFVDNDPSAPGCDSGCIRLVPCVS
jgi:hypothetical protein